MEAMPRDQSQCSLDSKALAVCPVATDEYKVVELYSMGTEKVKLFKHGIHIEGLGTKVEISLQGLFDDGAMVAAMSKPVYTKFQEELRPLYLSERQLKMADGTITVPLGLWRGQI
jgi:hypothetical protein